MTYTDAIQTLTAMKNLAEFYRKRNVGGTIIYGVEIERKCLIDEINALHTAIKALESHTEVVRCKDCKDHDSWSHTCVHWTHHCTPPGHSYKVNADDYCAWGERRAKE